MTDDNTQQQPKAKPGPKPKADPAPEIKLAAALSVPQDDLKVRVPQPEPSLGRMVRYVTASGTIRPAIITAVHEEYVDLTVFNSEGAVPATKVFHEDEAELLEHTYHWPSY